MTVQRAFVWTTKTPRGERVDAKLFGGAVWLVLELWPQGAELNLSATSLCSEASLFWRVSPVTASRVLVKTDGWSDGPTLWALRPSACRGLSRDILGAAAGLIYRAATPSGGRPDREEYAEGLRLLRRAGQHLVALIPKTARKLALRFVPQVRLRVARHISGDSTGRVAQLATVCPGLLSFVIALEDASSTEAAARIVEGILAGRRLPELLHMATDAWRTCARPAQRQPEVIPSDPLAPIANAPAQHTVFRRQRLLIRKAGPRVAPEPLWLPPPVSFAPEDIPRSSHRNARWYQVMKAAGALLALDARPRTVAASQFFSRNALRIPQEHAADLAAYSVAADLPLCRNTSADRVLAELQTWSKRQHTHGLDEALPAAAPGYCSAQVSLRPLKTVAELVAEGARMRSCVGSYAEVAVRGESGLFTGRVQGRRVTVELCRTRDRLVFRDARAFGNRPLKRAEREALKPWLEAIGCDPGALALGSAFHARAVRVHEWMEHVLNLLDEQAQEPVGWGIELLQTPPGASPAWLDALTRDLLEARRCVVVGCQLDRGAGFLLALLLRRARVESLRMGLLEEARFQDVCRAIYQSRLWVVELETVSLDAVEAAIALSAQRIPEPMSVRFLE